MAIPKGAPDSGSRQVFINFILDAQVGARLSDFTRYATPNDASLPLVRRQAARGSLHLSGQHGRRGDFLRTWAGRAPLRPDLDAAAGGAEGW
jgi:spermidine/putrescine transport system substrate-binding protein